MRLTVLFILLLIPCVIGAQSDTTVRASYQVEYYTLAGETQGEYQFAYSETGEYWVHFGLNSGFRPWQRVEPAEYVKLILWLFKHKTQN